MLVFPMLSRLAEGLWALCGVLVLPFLPNPPVPLLFGIQAQTVDEKVAAGSRELGLLLRRDVAPTQLAPGLPNLP